MNNIGLELYNLVVRLFPICRSITGNGVRQTLTILSELIPISIYEVPTGTKVFDWIVPKEWNIIDAYVIDPSGNKIIDFKTNNLHILGYSIPINEEIELDELQNHLFSMEEMPEAIPYMTSYYADNWGFCISDIQRKSLLPGKYKIFIDSSLNNGHLTYGEIMLPGKIKKEILISTYICHPSLANNELSGPVVTTYIAKWLNSLDRKYTYRIIFIPETIGSLTYISRNFLSLKKNVIAGFNVTCIGDNNSYSFLSSRYGNTYADKIADNIFRYYYPDHKKYNYLERGSDERQFCSPGIDLPIVSIMRTKYGEYPEYHTSLDNLDYISPEGLNGGYSLLKRCLEAIELNVIYKSKCIGEPQLSKRGLYPTISSKQTRKIVSNMMNFLAYADGTNDLLDISNIINVPIFELIPIVLELEQNDLVFSKK